MKRYRWLLPLALCAALPAAAAAADVGTSRDPLVTLSYLHETFMDEVLQKVDEKIAARDDGGTSANFTVVTLSNGQVLTGDIGCEVMLRVGSASCVSPSSPGLIDETTAGTLDNGGTLVQNHLYMATIEGRGVKAAASTVKLLVRGGYTIQ